MPLADVNGQRLHYVDSDPDGHKPPAVLVHGFLMDHRMFDPITAALEADFRVIRYDTRGFGQTPWDGKPFDFYDAVDDCAALLDHLGVKQATIGGMSRGGYMALRFALVHPARVRALVLMSTRSGVDGAELHTIYRQIRDTWRDHGPIDAVVHGNANGILGPEAEVPALWREWLPRWRGYAPAAVAAGIDAMIERDDIDDRLDAITAPALVVHGTADAGIPFADAERLAAALPDARGLVKIEGGHHAAVLARADVVIPPLRAFLRAYAT